MEELRSLFKSRPGDTRVVMYLPGSGGTALPMEIRGGVAFDPELGAEINRRIGEGLVRLELTSSAT
jgi:hypothetical protein